MRKIKKSWVNSLHSDHDCKPHFINEATGQTVKRIQNLIETVQMIWENKLILPREQIQPT